MKHSPRSIFLLPSLLVAGVSQAAPTSPCTDAESLKLKMNLIKETSHMLFVCGFENPEHSPPRGSKNLSEMKIYSVKVEKESDVTPEPKLLLETTALETHWVKKDKKSIFLDEVWWVNLKPVTALRSEITCTKRGCKVSRPQCVSDSKDQKKKKKPIAKKQKSKKQKIAKVVDPLTTLDQVLKDPTSDPEANTQELTAQVFMMSLRGNRKAQAFFLESKIPTGLQGDAADEWQASKAQLRRAKKYGCAR